MALEKQMELFQEGGMLDEGGTKDPVSGNDVPTGSLQKEVRDDIPAQLSEGEFVMPADVVRYHGLDKMMALRDEAKMGLQRMEAMGQMGNADEAIIPDGVPFDMNDLDLEDNDSSLEMQVGGFVPQPFGITQSAGTPFQYQQSAFANYTPQVSSVPTTAPAPYQAPVQQATPTMQPGTLPTFSQVVSPTMVTYVNDAGHELQIPVDADGNPLIPVPAGYKKKPDTPTDTTPDPTPPPVSAPATQQQDGDNDGPPSTAAPKTDQFGREEDPAITTIKETKPFQEIKNKIDPRGTFEKIKDDFLGAFGASTTSAEYDKALDTLAKDVAFAEPDLEKQQQLLNQIKDNLGISTRPELGMPKAPSLEPFLRNPDGTFKRDAADKKIPNPNFVDPKSSAKTTSPETTRVETAQVTADPAATVSEAATLSQDAISNIPSSGPEFEARVNRKFTELFNASPDTPTDILLKAAKEDALFDVSVERQAAAGTLAANLQTVGSMPIDEAALKTEAAAKVGESKRSLAEEAQRLGFGSAKSTMSTSELRDIVDRQRESNRKEAASLGISEEAYLDPDKRQAAISEAAQATREREREERINKEAAEQEQRYRDRGYSSEDAKKAGKNKARADNEAREQTGEPQAKAVTDRHGNPVRSASDGSVVTSNREQKDDSPEPDRRWCCSQMVHRGLWTQQYEFARLTVWSSKQPDWWKSGYHVWGKVLAKTFLRKKGFWTDVMQSFYDYHIRKKPYTWRTALAHVMVYPGVFICGNIWTKQPKGVKLASFKELNG